MKINNKILISLLIVLIAAISLSAVSAADDTANNTVSASAEQVGTVEYSGEVDMSGIISESATDATPVGKISENSTKTWDVEAGSNASTVQEIIDNSSAGDTIKFEKGDYNWHEVNDTGKAITIPHTLTIIGNDAYIECDNGFISKTGAVLDGTVISGLSFKMVQNSTWNGRGIQLSGVNNVTIQNCTFTNGNAGIRSQRNTNITIQNCKFYGSTNESSIGDDETGTKAVNIMGGSDHTIVDNYFGEDCLDGVSIASNAQNNFQFINNTFEKNWYGIFYGGGVRGVVIEGNTFKNNMIYDIGLVKAAGDTMITNNTFIAEPDQLKGTIIYIEQGNTAHGAPSNIGSITIEDNIFNNTDDTVLVDAVEIFSTGGPLLPLGNITIANNSYDMGVNDFTFMDGNWFGENDTYIISPATLDTKVISGNTTVPFGEIYYMQLITANGIAIPNANVTITVKYNDDGETGTYNDTTDEFGLIKFIDLDSGNLTITIAYAGTTEPINGYLYGASNTEINMTVTKGITLNLKSDTIIKGGKLVYVLSDDDYPLEGYDIEITINGKTYNRTTDKNGEASMNINLQPGDYNVTAYCELGEYDAIESDDIITVESNIITKNITLFYQNGTKFEATVLNGDGTPVGEGEVVKFNINGVIYNKTTDKNGIARLGINLKPGNYTITTMYGGIEISNQVVVKPTLVTENLVLTYKDGSKFNATVLDGQGKPIAGETVFFNINGVIYNKTTDKNGVASLTINLNPGEYIITSMWDKYQVGNNVTVKA